MAKMNLMTAALVAAVSTVGCGADSQAEAAKVETAVVAAEAAAEKALAKDPNEVVKKIQQRLGCFGAMIADVNDLKRSRVVGITEPVNGEIARKLLIDNPFGNASQKTPICIIKHYRQYQEKQQG